MKTKRFKRALILGVLPFLVVFMLHFFGTMSVQAASSLYFDADGNLIFTAVGGKDTTGVKYRTIGWIIKRYDMPINVPGQQYIIISKSGDVHSVPDPNNPSFLITSVKSDREEILGAVRKVSGEWEKQLVNYGGKVYIDTVMTVVQYGTIMGKINPDGSLSGEVYTTCEGIAGARPWGDPSLFKQYYDVTVYYPSQAVKPTIKYSTSTSTSYNYASTVLATFRQGSNAKGSEIYDVAAGIPGGEKMYLACTVSKYKYNTKMTLIRGKVDIPVKITTTYILKWTDYKGIAHSETQVVDRYYLIKRNYEYYVLSSANVYAAQNGYISSNAIAGNNKNFAINESVSRVQKIYGAAKEHVSYTINSSAISGGTKVINSTNKLRPNIPDENNQSLAEKAVTKVNVKSDKLIIGGNIVLSDALGSGKGKSPIYFVPPTKSVNITGLYSAGNVPNELYKVGGELSYKNISSSTISKNSIKVNSVKIHTPLVCYGQVICGKDNNQDLDIVDNTLVCGTKFTVSANSSGFHSELKGYGVQNYERFSAQKYVKFPFEVVRGDKKLSANSWIDLAEGTTFLLPENISMGEYEVEFRSYAKNSLKMLGNGQDIFNPEQTNKDGKYHMASDRITVHVTGRLYGMKIDEYTVGNKDVNGDEIDGKTFLMPVAKKEYIDYELTAVGDFGLEDTVATKLSYFYLDQGERIPVNVFYISGRDNISKGELKNFPLINEISFKEGKKIRENVTVLSGRLPVGQEIYIFPTEIIIENTSDIIKNQRKMLKGGAVVVNMDSTIVRDKKDYISYINKENARLGYCNMWKKEGFVYEQIINDEICLLEDGDAICLNGNVGNFYGYKVVGTH